VYPKKHGGEAVLQTKGRGLKKWCFKNKRGGGRVNRRKGLKGGKGKRGRGAKIFLKTAKNKKNKARGPGNTKETRE